MVPHLPAPRGEASGNHARDASSSDAATRDHGQQDRFAPDRNTRADLTRDLARDLVAPDLVAPARIYRATVAACTALGNPDPSLCHGDNGEEVLVVDAEGTLKKCRGCAVHAYVAFVLDDMAGIVPNKVTLRLHVADLDFALSPDQTGEVWRVQPFTLASLSAQTPLALEKLAESKSAGAQQNTPVEWSLPTQVAQPNTTLHLGILPIESVTDGVDYWNANGPHPPLLLIE